MATVALTIHVDYASNVWTHSYGMREAGWLDKAQKVAAQVVIGAFRTVATAVAKAEAGLQPFRERYSHAATRFCISLRTLPKAHPLATLKVKAGKRFISLIQKIALIPVGTDIDRMEVIYEYALAPWSDRIQVVGKPNQAEVVEPNDVEGIVIAASSSRETAWSG